MERQAIPRHGSLRVDGIFDQPYGRAEGLKVLQRTEPTGCQISERPLSPIATPGSWRIPDHDGFQCKSHSRFKKSRRAHRTDSNLACSSTAELAFARRQCSPSSCRYALSRFFAVERWAKSAGKQRTSSVPKRRPGRRPRTAGGTEILHAGPSGIKQELQKAVGFI